MLECNYCNTECSPGKFKLRSNLSCPKYLPNKHTFKFPELVSKITLHNLDNPVIQMLAIHTDKIFNLSY